MSFLESAIGWLAPPQCFICGSEGLALCRGCSTSGISPFGTHCWHCGKLSENGQTCPQCRWLGGPRAVWINGNYEGVARQLVQIYKFGQLRAAAEPMAELMRQSFLSFNNTERYARLDYLVVAVPTATSRVRQRGFDHSALLAKRVAGGLNLRYFPALGRLGQSRQLGSPREQRLNQIQDKYFVRRPAAVAGRNILLIDDVVTTGGTLIGAAKALRSAGAQQVDGLVFAKRL